jgi:ribose transport system permease protein
MADAAVPEKRKNFIIRFLSIREIGALLPLIVIFILSAISNSAFVTIPNLLDMLRATAYIFIIGVGMTFLLCGRGLDLSVGSQVGMTGVVLGALMIWWHIPTALAIPIALLVGAAAGALNGFFITVLRIPPFIATLATYYSYRGILSGVTKGTPITPMPADFKFLGQGYFLGVSYVIWFIVLLFAIGTFVLRKTKYGRYTLAMGGNPQSTRLSGININRLSFSLYVVMGVLCAITGIFFTSRFTSAQPTTGVGMELQVIAACIIGGVSLFGGVGSIAGTLIGAFFLVVLNNGMIMAHISGYWQQAVIGAIIIVAVVIDLVRKGDLQKKE